MQGRVLEDVELRQGRVRGRVVPVAAPEAPVGAEDAGGEDVAADDQPQEVVAHELEEGRVWKAISRLKWNKKLVNTWIL